MVNKNILTSRIAEIKIHLQRIKVYEKLTYEEFIENRDIQDIVEYNLFQIINHLINICEHIVVDENMGFPQTAYDAGEFLKKKDIWDGKDLDVFRKMIGFRNVLGHDYIDLDKKKVYEALTKGSEDIEGILKKIIGRFL